MKNAQEMMKIYAQTQEARLAEKTAKCEKFCDEIVEPALVRAAEMGYTQHTFVQEEYKGIDLATVVSILENLGFMVIVREERFTVKFGAWGK